MATKFKQVKCKSGITGWQGRLQDVYDNFLQFKRINDIYGIAGRLNYFVPNTLENLWNENPIIRGSVIPSDLERVKTIDNFSIGERVNARVEPNSSFLFDFTGYITSIDRGHIQVKDQDDNVFDCEPDELSHCTDEIMHD